MADDLTDKKWNEAMMNHKKTGLLAALMGVLALYGCNERVIVTCGDMVCDASIGETLETCPEDCGVQGYCGDGICDVQHFESILTCRQDCEGVVVCGDMICDNLHGESVQSCPEDCAAGAKCGNGVCEVGENSQSCPRDCPANVVCGNGICESGETAVSCPRDCETDAEICGNGVCASGEDAERCPEDCGTVSGCGNGICETGETEENCASDCKTDVLACGNGQCELGEPESCAEDCEGLPDTPIDMAGFDALTEAEKRFMFDYARVSAPADGPAGEDETARLMRKNADFFAFPYPSELRTDEYGRPDMSHFELPVASVFMTLISNYLPTVNDLLSGLMQRVQTERAGFPTIGAVYFRASQKIDQTEFPDVFHTALPESCFQLINVEPGSKHYRERLPVYVTSHPEADRLWAADTLVMRPVPGVGPHPGDRHIAVIGNCLTVSGQKLSMSRKLHYILGRKAPAEINARMSFYVDQLEALAAEGELGMELSDVRAMTGYRTMDPARELDQIAADLKEKGEVVTDEDGVAIGKYTSYQDYYKFRGTFKTVSYMAGTFPYQNAGDGEIRFDEHGQLVSEGKHETVYYEIVIPKTEMPDTGYPIAVYGHGSGGDADSHVHSEGAALIRGGVPMAMIGFDGVLFGERQKNSDGSWLSSEQLFTMLTTNPVTIRESWRQTVIDMLVIYDLLERGAFVLPPVPGSSERVIFDPSYGMYMGHSQGSQEAGMLLGVTGQVKNAFLSAGGAGISMAFVDEVPDLSDFGFDVDESVTDFMKDKSIATLLGMLFAVGEGALSYDAFVTSHFVQGLTEPLDPLDYAHRFIKEPAAGMTAKNIAQSIGIGDTQTPNSCQFAMISAIGLPPVGEILKTSDAMKLVGFDEALSAPVSGNIKTSDGDVTAGSLQYEVEGHDPHFAIYYNDSARHAYVKFFETVLKGVAVIE